MPSRWVRRAIVTAASAIFLAACSSGTPPAGSPTGSIPASAPATTAHAVDPATDKLAQVLDRGTLVLSTDPVYPPQSYSVEGAVRLSVTKCAPNQMTAPEITGYDAETGKAVAAALGVEPCFVVPTWTEITGGNWGDRWDVAWGSGAINADRMTRLYMTQPYYAHQQRFFVRTDSSYKVPSDLDGKKIGACASCSHEYYLKGTLVLPGVTLKQKVANPEVVAYQAERPGLDEVASGKIDAFLCAETVGNQAIKEGLALRGLEEEAFFLYSTGFVDRTSGLDAVAFLDRVNGIVRDLHADGTLKSLSIKFFGVDYATKASEFDLASIGQAVP